MRKKVVCVLMMTLCLLSGCGGGGGGESGEGASLRQAYQDMAGADLTADLSFTWNGQVREYTLACAYVPAGKSTVEVLAPESLAGVKATVDGETLALTYEDTCLDAGTVSDQALSPAAVLPQLLDALREGWLLEESREKWGDTPCLRLTVDTTGSEGGKVLWTVWLEEETGLPVHGEVAVDDEIIFQVEFTDFAFHATMS